MELSQDNFESGRDEIEEIKPKKVKRWTKFVEYVKKHKTGSIITAVVLVILICFGIGFYFLRHQDTTGETAIDEKDYNTGTSAETTKTYNILDGLAVDSSMANRHPLAVIVENQVDARPQSGLDKASLVYEAIAEGGITRFFALYSSYDAEKVGPVRSIRTYFVDWAHGYNAYLAHVGGNIDALDKISAEGSYDLNQFTYSSPYWREYSAGLATEHTMYTSTVKLYQQATKLNYPTDNSFKVYNFKDDPTSDDLAAVKDQQKISINYGNASYNVYYLYDKATNSYKRYQASKAHVDAVTKNQLNPKNVIVMTVSRTAIKTRINEDGYNMVTVGSGAAKIFIDGKTINGTWKKTSTSSREVFYDESGQEITFNRGQFWISVIPPDCSVTVE